MDKETIPQICVLTACWPSLRREAICFCLSTDRSKQTKGQAAAQTAAIRDYCLMYVAAPGRFWDLRSGEPGIWALCLQDPSHPHSKSRCHCAWPAVGDSNNSHFQSGQNSVPHRLYTDFILLGKVFRLGRSRNASVRGVGLSCVAPWGRGNMTLWLKHLAFGEVFPHPLLHRPKVAGFDSRFMS